MEKKSKELFELLDSAYNDPEIKKDVLIKIILDAAGSLEKEENSYPEICSFLVALAKLDPSDPYSRC